MQIKAESSLRSALIQRVFKVIIVIIMLCRRLFRNLTLLASTPRFYTGNGFNNFNRPPKKPKQTQEQPKKEQIKQAIQEPEKPANTEKDLYGDNKKEDPKLQQLNRLIKQANILQSNPDEEKPVKNQLFKPRKPKAKFTKLGSSRLRYQLKPETKQQKSQPGKNLQAQKSQSVNQQNLSKDNIKPSQTPNDQRTNSSAQAKQQNHKLNTEKSAESKPHETSRPVNLFEQRKRSGPQLKSQPPKQTERKKGFDKKGFQEEMEKARRDSMNAQKKQQQIHKQYEQLSKYGKKMGEFLKKYMVFVLQARQRYHKLILQIFERFNWNKSYIPKFSFILPAVAFFCVLAFLKKYLLSQPYETISFSDLAYKIEHNQLSSHLTIYTTSQRTGEKQFFNVVTVTGMDKQGHRFQCQVDNEKTVYDLVQEKNKFLDSPIMIYTHKNIKNMGRTEILRVFAAVFAFYFLFSVLAMTRKTMMAKKPPSNQNMDKMFGSVFGRGKKLKSISNVKFSSVAGMDSAKKQIAEFVEFLKDPKRFHQLGARIPRGALLSGPPGTGKTMLAKACAGQAGVAFFSLSGSEFVEMYVGVGASRVRDLFKQAKKSAPAIIFIDEIDAVGRKRANGQFGGNDERDSTLNQLLVQMDGFHTKSDVVVFAATNRKELLDPALTRPGRFDRTIEVELPDLQGRKQIFLVHLAPIKLNIQKLSVEDYANRLATLTPGFSGADIANLCNEAAILAARKDSKLVEKIDFEMASERVIAGTIKKNMMTEEDRKVVAYHESGHGVISWFLEGASPLLKLTIIPRSKGSLGFAQYLPDDKVIRTKENLLDQLCVILGGRVVEEVFFGRITTGAQDDLQKVSKLANKIVKDYGMTQKLGNVNYSETDFIKEYSETYAKKIDEEVHKIIKDAEKRTRQLVSQHKDKIQKLAETLLQKETIDNKVIREVLGDRPFGTSKSYSDYVSNA